MADYMDNFGMDNTPDIMGIMAETKRQMSSALPDTPAPELLGGSSVQEFHHLENTLSGRPITHQSPSLTPALREDSEDIMIRIPQHQLQPLDPLTKKLSKITEEDDIEQDLSMDLQKNEKNVHLARQIHRRLQHVPDEVANIDPQEQQWRMKYDPDNEHNIFVIKFGKDEEQHWRLPWSHTTNLFCHMDPNKLLIEQSKFNALYMKYAASPQTYKQSYLKAKAKQNEKKNKTNDSKLLQSSNSLGLPQSTNGGGTVSMNQMSAQQSMADTVQIQSSVNGFSRPPSGRSELSFQEHAELSLPSQLKKQTTRIEKKPEKPGMILVAGADDEKLNQNEAMMNDEEENDRSNRGRSAMNNGYDNVDSNVTPLTAQIALELRILSARHSEKRKQIGNESFKPTPTPKGHIRRPSLSKLEDKFQDEEYSETESDDEEDDDDDDEDEDGNGRDAMKKSKFRLFGDKMQQIDTHGISKRDSRDEQVIKRIDTKGNEYSMDYAQDGGANGNGDDNGNDDNDRDHDQEEEEKAPFGIGNAHSGSLSAMKHGIGNVADHLGFSSPKLTLCTWMAMDAWNKVLFIGDEWDALNYIEIKKNRIEYFINCAAGYCGFEHERRLKHLWLEQWKEERKLKQEENKEKQRKQREQFRKKQLEKYERQHPEWRPKNPKILEQLTSNTHALRQREIRQRRREEKYGGDDLKDNNDDDPNQGSGDFQDLAREAARLSPVGVSGLTTPTSLKEVRFAEPRDETARAEFDLFRDREEFKMIEQLHQEIAMLEEDNSDHSSMNDEYLSSDDYDYDSEEMDEFQLMDDEEIIEQLCPYRFLNVYAHNWEGYRILDFHMNDVWEFIQECCMRNAAIRNEYRKQREAEFDDRIHGGEESLPTIGCLMFCTELTVPWTRIKSEIANDEHVDLETVGRSLCNITKMKRNEQEAKEEEVYKAQEGLYREYLEHIEIAKEEVQSERKKVKDHGLRMKRRMSEIHRQFQEKQKYYGYEDGLRKTMGLNYKYWSLPDKDFWEDFENLKTRDEPLNRLFAASMDRTAALALGFLVHNGMHLRRAYKMLVAKKAHLLRNQSFLRQLIELNAMKHDLIRPDRKKAIQFRDEYEAWEYEEYHRITKYYQLKS